MERVLREDKLLETAERLQKRIAKLFPDSGLTQIAGEIVQITREAMARAERIRRPDLLLRGGLVLLALLALAGVVKHFYSYNDSSTALKDRMQFMDTTKGAAAYMAGAAIFLVTLEVRLKRRRALKAIHELRAMAHIIDMHQLTKDPDRLGRKDEPLLVGAKVTDADLMGRYLNYCTRQETLMSPIKCRSVILAAAILLLVPAWSRGQALSKQQVAALGKAATAFVEIKDKGTGSAFCIHSSGFFITNHHVVHDAGDSVILVVDSGLKSQKVLRARIARADVELDLALLRVEGDGKYAALTLGSDEGVAELADLVAFGFPFGKALGLDPEKSPPKKMPAEKKLPDGMRPVVPSGGAFPSITVSAGTVTALRRKDGELHRIQMDAGVNPGSSGGPVLDMNGKVIGVVVSGVFGGAARLNFAIPVSHVSRFVARPDLEFTPPALDRANIHKPVQLQARAVTLLEGATPVSLELTLKTMDRERKLAMERAGDNLYRVTAPPVPKTEDGFILRLAACFPDARIEGTVENRTFKVGDRSIKLSEIDRLYGAPKPRIVLADGKVLDGAPSGLDAVPVRAGAQTRTVDLAKAMEVAVNPAEEFPCVSFTIVATQDGKSVNRLSRTVYVQPLDRKAMGIKAPVLASDKEEVRLPAEVVDMAVGGSGRFLVLHLPKKGSLAIFDVNHAKIRHFISVPDEIKFAAGLDYLIVASRKEIQRYSLRTFAMEVSRPLNADEEVLALAMGAATNEALVRWGKGPGPWDSHELLDVVSGKVTPLSPFPLGPNPRQRKDQLRAASDGSVFALYRPAPDPAYGGPQSLLFKLGGRWTTIGPFYPRERSLGHILPAGLGRVVYTGNGLYTIDPSKTHPIANLNKVTCPEGYGFIPALDSPHYLAIGNENVLVYAEDNRDQPIVTLQRADFPDHSPAKEGIPFEKRIHFVSTAGLIVTVPTSNDRLVLYRFRVDDARNALSLRVDSKPPTSAKNGETFRYQLLAKSRNGTPKYRYRVEYAPPGLTISEAGLIEWKVPEHLGPAECFIGVRVSDADGKHEAVHRFSIQLDTTPPLLLDNRSLKKEEPGIPARFDRTLAIVSHDGTHVASFTPDGFTLWNAKTGREQILYKAPLRPQRSVSATFSADSKRIAASVVSIGTQTPIKVWDVATGKEIATFDIPRGDATSLCFSGNGKYLAALMTQTAKIWETTTWHEIAEPKIAQPRSQFTFSPNSKHLVVGASNTIRAFDTATGEEAFVITANTPFGIRAFRYSPDAARLVHVHDNGIGMHDAHSGKELFKVVFEHTTVGPLWVPPTFSPDGKLVACQFRSTSGFRMQVLDAATGQLILRWAESPQSFFFLPEGICLATPQADGKMRVWEIAAATAPEKREPPDPRSETPSPVTSPTPSLETVVDEPRSEPRIAASESATRPEVPDAIPWYQQPQVVSTIITLACLLAAAAAFISYRRPARTNSAMVTGTGQADVNTAAQPRMSRPSARRLPLVALTFAGVILAMLLLMILLPHWREREQPSNTAPEQASTSASFRVAQEVPGEAFANSVGVKFRLVPAGKFKMGSPREEIDRCVKLVGDGWQKDALPTEGPEHEVEITRPFFMGTTEVTIAQFRRFVEANPTHKVGDERWKEPGFDQVDDQPVVWVSWNNAVDFCRWLSEKEGKKYRLPTEAEWEYCCRAGKPGTRYGFGNEELDLRWYAWNTSNSAGKTHPVGKLKANEWGLYDMHGNAWEWCQDVYQERYYQTSPKQDPEGPSTSGERVIRGGSYYDVPVYCRSAFRLHHAPEFRNINLGFRIVCEAP